MEIEFDKAVPIARVCKRDVKHGSIGFSLLQASIDSVHFALRLKHSNHLSLVAQQIIYPLGFSPLGFLPDKINPAAGDCFALNEIVFALNLALTPQSSF